MADSPRHSVSVAAVVVDNRERALLIRRRDNGHWEPPGGVLELGEDIIEGLRREVAEETGLQVEPSALTGVYKNMARGIVALVFRCRQTGGRARTASETAEVRWATREEVTGLAAPRLRRPDPRRARLRHPTRGPRSRRRPTPLAPRGEICSNHRPR